MTGSKSERRLSRVQWAAQEAQLPIRSVVFKTQACLNHLHLRGVVKVVLNIRTDVPVSYQSEIERRAKRAAELLGYHVIVIGHRQGDVYSELYLADSAVEN